MRRRLAVRASAWLATCGLVVLAGRWLVYALAPSPTELALRLQGETGGARPLVIALAGVTAAAVVGAAIVWLASVGVRERQRLDSRRPAPRPISLRRLLVSAALLFLASALVFTIVESTIHALAGLGFHGIHCLLGPVHENALPVLGALSVLGAAAFAALEHLLGWARSVVELARLRPRTLVAALLHTVRVPVTGPPARPALAAASRPRAPPR